MLSRSVKIKINQLPVPTDTDKMINKSYISTEVNKLRSQIIEKA